MNNFIEKFRCNSFKFYRQQDLIHPNQIGQKILADKITKSLEPLLKQAKLPVSFK